MDEKLRMALDRSVARAMGYTITAMAYAFGTTRPGWILNNPSGQAVTVPQRTEAQAWEKVPRFSTDLADAEILIDYLYERGIGCTMTSELIYGGASSKRWDVCFMRYTSINGSWAGAEDTLAAAIVAAFMCAMTLTPLGDPTEVW